MVGVGGGAPNWGCSLSAPPDSCRGRSWEFSPHPFPFRAEVAAEEALQGMSCLCFGCVGWFPWWGGPASCWQGNWQLYPGLDNPQNPGGGHLKTCYWLPVPRISHCCLGCGCYQLPAVARGDQVACARHVLARSVCGEMVSEWGDVGDPPSVSGVSWCRGGL